MNVEHRIGKLERLLTDVAQRRERARVAARAKPGKRATVAGWDSLERGFRAALVALQRQGDRTEGELRQ